MCVRVERAKSAKRIREAGTEGQYFHWFEGSVSAVGEKLIGAG